MLAFEIEGVASRNRSGDPLYIDNTAHPANRRLALARSKETHVKGFGLDLDLVGEGNNGHYASFAWVA
jgi:6-phosphogluconolactonase/glucosamine-6-phosphate isomerase/deaminase